MPAVPSLERVPELWFSDASLVFQVENSMFRVHSGILAAQSSVFRDMLSFPQPEESDTFDGCPRIVLHDKAADARAFFRCIFDSSFLVPPFAPPLDVLSGILRLSAKYDVEHLRQRCLRHLSDIYPTTLKAWDLLGYSRDIISFCAPPKVYPVFQKCNTELLQLAQFVAENWSACHFPLEIWEEHDWEEVASDLCAECVRQCRKAHAKARQEFWNRMPAIFSLNSVWDELERLKEAALKS